MKRILYILLCLPLWLACTDENIPASNNQVEEGKEVQLRMSVALEEMNIASSRAFGDNITDFPSLWIVAFDKDGYLVEWAKATDLALTGNGATKHETEFSVILHATSEHRTLHFIANYADELTLEYGHESNLIGSLSVSGNKDVYWHRKELSGGINTNPDYIAANFRRIPLLRNFAKITVGVDEDVNNFKLTGFYVLNVPTSGTVAPYSNGQFVNYMSTTIAETAKTYEELNLEGYNGTMPSGVTYGQTTTPGEWVDADGSFYMYENTYLGNEKETTSILIKGTFSGSSTDTYYRADLTLPNVATGLSEYYHILRNFEYHLNITKVIAAGKATAKAAIDAPANNNLSGSVQVMNLSNISDGKAKLEVSYTDMVLVSTDAVTLKYRFLTDVSDEESVANSRIQFYTPDGGEVINSYSPTSSTGIAVDGEGWSTITITPVGKLPEYSKEQILTLYDNETKLRREVKYTLRRKLDMVVNCTPKVEKTAGEDVVVNICIPNNLNENLFPLEFAIEAQTSETSSTLKQYISPANTEVMEVTTGGSIVEGHLGEKSYQYIKELTYEVYQTLDIENELRVFPVNFVTNTAESASTVYVDNKYFNKGSDFFVNTLPALVDTEYYGTGKDVFFMFESTTAGSYTITATNATPASQSVEMAANDTYETVLKTSTWSGHTSVTVGNTTKTGATIRNKLAMKAASTSGPELVSATQLYVYTSEADAKALAGSNLITTTNGKLTSSYESVVTINNLAETDLLWFAYETAEYYYFASATAKALAEGTALLNFTKIEKPLKISAALIGEQYYGGLNFGGNQYPNAVKTVTLNFETNKTGEYTIAFKEGTNNTTETIDVTNISDKQTVAYSTLTWGDAISATITYNGTSVNVPGDNRNILWVKVNSITGTNLSATQDIKISTNAITNYWDYATALKVTNKAELEGNGVEIEIDNLYWNTTYYINYLYERTSGSDRYYRKNVSVYQLTSNADISGFSYN